MYIMLYNFYIVYIPCTYQDIIDGNFLSICKKKKRQTNKTTYKSNINSTPHAEILIII